MLRTTKKQILATQSCVCDRDKAASSFLLNINLYSALSALLQIFLVLLNWLDLLERLIVTEDWVWKYPCPNWKQLNSYSIAIIPNMWSYVITLVPDFILQSVLLWFRNNHVWILSLWHDPFKFMFPYPVSISALRAVVWKPASVSIL